MKTLPIVVVEFDDGSISSQETSSIGAARGICIELKGDPSVLAVTIYNADDKIDWAWERDE